MKQRVVVAMLAVCALLCTDGILNAQVKVHVQLNSNWQSLATCPPGAISGGQISLIETNPDDFFGDNGGNNSYYTLNIALPPGLAFVQNGGAVNWTNKNSSNLQNGTGVVGYMWSKVDDTLRQKYGILNPPHVWPASGNGEVNTISIRAMKVKNTHMNDEVYLLPVQIKVLPGSGDVTPSGNFFAWTSLESGAMRPDDSLLTAEERELERYVRGLPQLGPVTGLPDPIITTTPGPAEGIKFVIQPAVGPFDVQQGVSGTASNSLPTLQAVDCNGYYTTTFPSSNPTPNVNLTLVGPSTSSLWDGSGPTYVGAVGTVTPTSGWSSGKLPLVVSVADARQVVALGSYQIEATSNLMPSSNAISNIATSTEFTVKKRPITFSSDPVLLTGYDASMNNMFMPIYGARGITSFPESDVRDVAGSAAQGIRATLAMHPNTVTAIPFNTFGEIISGRYQETVISPSNGLAQFVGVNPATGPGFTLTPVELNNPLAVNFFTYVPTKFFGIASTTGTPGAGDPDYLDPRYIVPTPVNVSVTPLPVELISFTALVRNQAVQLKWSTATETNNYGFDVERSLDGTSWEKLGFVAGFGTTSSQRDYGYTNRLSDADMLQRTISYRLRQIDRDGTEEYSPVVTVALAPAATNMTLLQNFPNPFNPSTNISFNLPESGAVTLTVFNELGVEVARIHDGAQLESGWHTASFNASALPSGVYMYRLQTGTGSTMKTMIVSK